MSVVKPIQIDVANQALEAWNQLGVLERAVRLEQSLVELPQIQVDMARWQLDNARHEIAEACIMPGPTGESNVLSNHGRGTFLVTTQQGLDLEPTHLGLIGAVYAALVAGNPVITVGSTGQSIMDSITPHVPQGVIQNVAAPVEDSIIEAHNLAGIAILCDKQHAQQLAKRLANKTGLLCQLVAETDWEALSTVSMPNYILRFVTEQTITTNTTAIGGNATLLALGSKEE